MKATRSDRVLRAPSRTVLSQVPERVVVFLRGASSHTGARAALAAGGYTERDHREGCSLLLAACAYAAPRIDPRADDPARHAQAELATWVRTHFRRLRVATERLHPEALALFAGLTAEGEAESVLLVATFLRRLEKLSRRRAPADATLVARGLGPAERARLRTLVARAQHAAPMHTVYATQFEDDREAELIALYRWHADWAATARALIKRKDALIALGLAARARSLRQTWQPTPPLDGLDAQGDPPDIGAD